MESNDIKLIQGDCLEKMKDIPDGSVNCIITSPPYNVNLGNNKFKKKGYNSYNDNLSHSEYLTWIETAIKLAYSKLAHDGRICINIGDGKNGKVTTHSDFIQILKNNGFHIISTIIWNKKATNNRTAWGSFMSPSCPSFPTMFEYIIIAGKTDKLIHKGTPTITKEEFIEYSNSMWTFAPEYHQKEIGHPAVFPIELPYRCIQMLTYENDIVLDIFMGSGTTGLACINTNRRFIGIEKDDNYFEIAQKRIGEAIKQKQQTLFNGTD